LDLDEEFVLLDYQLLYSVYSEAPSTEAEIRTFHSLFPIRQATYLNWGCGAWSKTIDVLRRDGWDVWGFEPSASVSGQHVAKSRAELSTLFDGIFSNNVIEHFRDPVAQFREFHSRLKEGGKMAHSSPCFEYAYSFTRFHSLFLLGRSPYVLAKKTGFRVTDTVREGEYMNFVFERS
jgi:SAM-dependent methyltransferase